ncbi:MAG: LysM peptidoglycan-binding domain-containing protein, partial [Ignavibacteria bacterium]|nr:LysM peptidoglycan-binding domain-containing protein [Ignavibacteria bacterium]
VSEGDNLSKIAGENNVSVADLKEWNSLETDKITIGQKLKIYSGNVKTSVHTVSEGENLTIIANEYGVSVAELKDINQLESDVIFSGQKLKIIDTGNNTSKSNIKTSGEKKTYKVKKGDTLASISNSNNVSIQDVKDWNNLKSDKVILDQILKLYNANPKIRKKK